MAWNNLTTAEVLQEFTPAEQVTLQGIQGATGNLADILLRAIQSARGAISAGGYELGSGVTIPDQLRGEVIAIARWRWLISFPQLKVMQTAERKAANDEAVKKLAAAANQEFNIESPTTASGSGNWNSERKIIGRAFPIPTPGSQFQTSSTNSGYANPDGPEDEA